MTVPPIPTRHLEAIYRRSRWTAIDSYRRDAIDAGDWLTRARKSRYDRICDWLGETFSGPCGFVWFAGTLLPIAAAMWAIGYFGVRELVGLFQ